MEFRNPQFSNAEGTAIDVEINHPRFGWIPFTATPYDYEDHGRAIYDEALAAGDIAAFVPPTIEEVRARMPILTARQFWLAAASINVSKDLVVGLVDASTLPDKLEMKIEIVESPNFERSNPYIDLLAELLEISPTELDDLWVWAGNI